MSILSGEYKKAIPGSDPRPPEILFITAKTSVFPLSPEEQRDGTGAGMGTDDRADIADLHFPFHLGEGLFHQRRRGFGIFHTVRLADIDFAAVILAAVGILSHAVNQSLDRTFFGADFGFGDEMPCAVHIENGADAQNTTDKAGGSRYAAVCSIGSSLRI